MHTRSVNWLLILAAEKLNEDRHFVQYTFTRYGEGRASPRSFLTHHVVNISTAIQTADAQTILNAASARMLRVSFGVM